MTAATLNPTPESEPHPAPPTLPVPRAILYATLFLGAFDAADGVVFRGLQGQNPIQVLQYIASSLLGAKSFGRACKRGTWPPPAFRHFAGSRGDLYPCEPTHRCFAYAVGARGTAVWRCRVGSYEPVGVAAHRGWSQPNPGCGISQWPHRARPVRRVVDRVLRKEGGGRRANGLLEKQANAVPVPATWADRLSQKVRNRMLPPLDIEHTDTKAADVQAGTTSFASFKGKNVKPVVITPLGAGVALRGAVGATGKKANVG